MSEVVRIPQVEEWLSKLQHNHEVEQNIVN